MRKTVLGLVVALALLLAPSANAAIPSVFNNTGSPVTCTVQASGATTGQRFCGTSTARVPSWDTSPIDVSVTFPPVPASGPDGNFPLVGIYHGWGGSKVTPSNAATQRWVTQGYAVFSISDRGWGQSCGALAIPKPAACTGRGYIHLMSNAYEVRDAQYLMGQLADDGVIDPQRIGATGGSYGGGMSAQLAALKDRTELPDGSLVPWKSPNGLDMQIAAAAPEYPWTDIAQSLVPNGSTLDYVAKAPYSGPMGDHRFGIQKQNWNSTLYSAGSLLGFYAPTTGVNCPGGACPDPTADMTDWNTWINTGGPYDSDPKFQTMLTELKNHHSSYYIDDSVAPAPMLLSSGWNDDLFPVDETIRLYNKIRADHPNTPVQMFHLDFGHSPRAATPPAADSNQLVAAENAWFAKYVMGTGSTPSNAVGGVSVLTSHCPTTAAGTLYTAPNWASIAPGEIRYSSAPTQTIVAPGTAPSNAFTSGTICTTTSGADNASAATYKLDPAPAGGFTIVGAPTVTADMTVNSANDGVYARIYDVDPGTNTEQLIGRQLYRPTGVGTANAPQLFQLHPQAWKVAAGHVVKLELLAQDSQYGRTAAAAAPQQSISVSNLKLSLPVVDSPGSLDGLVQSPAPKILTEGYQISRDADQAPDVSNDAPGGTVTVADDGTAPDLTVTASDEDSEGADLTLTSVTGLPDGITLDADTQSGTAVYPGTDTWKLAGTTTDDPGTYNVTAKVVDDWGLEGTTSFDVVIRASQTIDFPSIDDHLLTDGDFDPGASASSGLGVSYSASGPCSIVSGNVHITGLGSCEVTASQAGNANYKAASDVSKTFLIQRETAVEIKGQRVTKTTVKKGAKIPAKAKVTAIGVKKVGVGHITFTIDGDPVGGTDVNAGGIAAIRDIDTSGLSVGAHTFRAKYSSGAGAYAPAMDSVPLNIAPKH